MNQKAAVIAWEMAMEHNMLYRLLTPIMEANDGKEYNAAKKRCSKKIYERILPLFDGPEIPVPEGLIKMLEEPTAPGP